MADGKLPSAIGHQLSANRTAGLPKTDSKKRAVGKQVGRQHAFCLRARGKEITMEKAMRLDQDSRVQYRLQECPLEDNSDVLESGQVGGSKVRILRLVTTPLEGYKLLRKLRSDPLMSDVPIIILTR
jgi:hypothetical protein